MVRDSRSSVAKRKAGGGGHGGDPSNERAQVEFAQAPVFHVIYRDKTAFLQVGLGSGKAHRAGLARGFGERSDVFCALVDVLFHPPWPLAKPSRVSIAEYHHFYRPFFEDARSWRES